MRFKKYIKENMSNYKIYFDMDGVLTDFSESFKKIDGRTTQEVEKEGDNAFWDHVDKGGLEFWSKMPWIKGSKKLWNYAKSTGIPIAILSAPARSLPNSPKGKQIWIGRELGPVETIFIRAKNKKEYADDNNILIDDQLKNIQDWNRSGGIGILFKSPEQAIRDLKKAIGK